MPRPRKFVEADVVRAAAAVFAASGYAGTTMDDLSAATGLGKQSIYNTFGGKFALFLRALEADAAETVADVGEALDDVHGTPIQKIHAHVMMTALAAGAADVKSSLFAKGTTELSDRYSEVAGAATRTFGEIQKMYAGCFVDAQECGELDPAADANALAVMFVAYHRGLYALGAAGVDHREIVESSIVAFDLLPLTARGRAVVEGDSDATRNVRAGQFGG